MNRLTACILIGASVLAACSSPGAGETIPADEQQKIIVRPFSDSLQADTFKVKIEGSKPKDMQLAFTIRSFEGRQIYSISIKAADLFKNYDATINLNKKDNQIKFLKEEISRFFDEESFMEPAVTEQENPDQYVPDRVFFEELKKNQLSGFIYRLGKEHKVYIAWSVTEKKVKPYYICCK
ncbi:MAG TPA: hypothetical protein VK541_14360 [Pedobacter sp.]|uniref:hypothetical protein n=1 Tax=Pedobacter sp. TaxID=1411316 RepID=UPI002B5705FC|nr:hypothetical protein [Pedobacter sp.]HMI03662.1 hypothetical protein [Pedobacter sp.]